MSFSDYFESALLRMLFHNQSYTPPDSYWISLSTKNIGDDAVDNREPDPSRSYSRVEIGNNISETGFIRIGDYLYNSGQINFSEVTNNEWGTIISFGLWDSETDGNLIAYGNLTNNKNIKTTDIARIEPTGIRIGLD